MPNGDDRQQQLLANLRAARDEYVRILDEVEKLNREVCEQSHGMPHPDGTQAIASLGKQRAFAFERYREALATFTGKTPVPRLADATSLTPRERKVLVLIARGNSTMEVAKALGIAFKTAACHRGRILSKLDVHNTADLTRAAIRMGLIPRP